jgi:uncharacterized damage-inducible protein DinB
MADAAITFLHAMACNNAWANHRLLSACARLTQAEFEAERTSFFPSLQATLNHILYIDWFYVDALEGGTLGPRAWAVELPCPTVAELKVAQAAVDRRLIAFCAGLTAERLDGPVRLIRADHVQVESAQRVLLHIFQHDIHHRGQAHAMLAGTAVTPPQIDEFFLREEAPLRAGDLAELGFSEAGIWLEDGSGPDG